ncbi:MAG: hypothetical protein JWN48_6050 [Myxococcaceae bacterium]|nr:hypothetical protein [Myxococcaceae bacterium]
MNDELTRRLARASAHLDPGFSSAHVERALSGLSRRRARRRRLQRGAALSSVLVAALLGWIALRSPAPGAAHSVSTRDGSHARLLEPDTVLQVQRDGTHEVALSLERGAGHFEVSKRPSRRYRVHAGVVSVQVLGTVFDIERRGARSEVRVEEGAVQVSWPGGQTVLHAGESGWFPRLEADARLESAPPSAPQLEPASPGVVLADDTPTRLEPARVEQAERGAPRHEAWRALERAGKHGEAFRSLAGARTAHVDDLEGLLLAADAARLSQHPREAARYLARLVERYPGTAQAHLAAFTLGGLWLQDLHAPGRAAGSFARAYQLDPQGPLAEDALAREAEAEALAGEPERAARTAARYLERYPRGARRAELERYLGAQ